MTDESLREHVTQLRAELSAAHDLDRGTRDELHQLARDVETALESRDSAASDAAAGYRERLADWVRELEVSHPKLSSTIGNLVDTLAFYGL